MFEQIFHDNVIVIFIFCIYYILNADKPKEINKKMLLCYLFIAILRYFDIIDLKVALPLFLIIAFIYLELITDDNFKLRIFNNYIYKILDFIFIFVFNFKIIIFSLLLYFLSHSYQLSIEGYPSLKCLSIIVEFILFFYLLSKVSSQDFIINDYDVIIDKINKVNYTNYLNEKLPKEFIYILTYYEDQTFFLRKNKYTLLCKIYLKYKLNLLDISYDNIVKKGIKINRYIYYFKKIIKKLYEISKMLLGYIFLGKKIRGFSTIEMQLLRTLALRDGYVKKARTRKLYEIIYTPIFYKELKSYLKSKYKVSDENYRNYLLAVYVCYAPIIISNSQNNYQFTNMLEFWNKRNVNKLTKEEFFIGVICLSNKLTIELLNYDKFISFYANGIKRFDLNKENLKNCLTKINQKIKNDC